MPVPLNIDTILAIKFPGDKLSEGQIRDYPKIAGADNFRILESGDCDCKRRGRRVPVTEPVRSPVTTPMPRQMTVERRWYQPSPSPAPAPAPQPVRPSYGPVVSGSEGVPLSSYLKSGAKVVGGVVFVAGALGLLYVTGGFGAPVSAEAAAAGVALIVTGLAVGTSGQVKTRKDNEA